MLLLVVLLLSYCLGAGVNSLNISGEKLKPFEYYLIEYMQFIKTKIVQICSK